MTEDVFVPTATPFARSKYAREYERGRTRLIESLIGNGEGASALDIGCGPGHFTRILSEKGWRVTAVDTDPQNLEQTRPFAAEVRQGDALSFLAGEPGSYDLALALELIEHVPRSQGDELLRRLHSVLRPGGTLILSTPNRWSLEGLGGYYWGERMRRWGRWDAWDPTHVHIYSSREIARAVRSAGFQVTDRCGYWYRGHVPFLGTRTMPIQPEQRRWPWNRLGFDVVVRARA